MAERLAASSYPADESLLAELRAAWPPPEATDERAVGFAATPVADAEPAVALRLTDRFSIVLASEPGAEAHLVVPLARADGRWRRAVAGDGLSAFVAGAPMASERALGVDQTNDSVIVGERLIVKWFRRTGPEPSRATILLAHLAERGFAEIPAPLGALTWRSPAGRELTVAQGDAFLPDARDGWEWCVDRLERHVAHGDDLCPADCDPWIGRRLGRLVARLHAALLGPSTVIPEPPDLASPADAERWRGAALATLDEAVRLTAPEPEDHATLLAIAPALGAVLGRLPVDRRLPVQPVHGDLHVGQVLEWPGGLAVIDFDGNPALTGDGNDLRQPVERDVAQLLSSIDHVGRVVAGRIGGRQPAIIAAWIARNRRDLLATLDADETLLAAFEVEQECRELAYAGRFLPRWRYAPMATLRARFGR